MCFPGCLRGRFSLFAALSICVKGMETGEEEVAYLHNKIVAGSGVLSTFIWVRKPQLFESKERKWRAYQTARIGDGPRQHPVFVLHLGLRKKRRDPFTPPRINTKLSLAPFISLLALSPLSLHTDILLHDKSTAETTKKYHTFLRLYFFFYNKKIVLPTIDIFRW